jgi:fumarylacetoacetase
MLDKKSSFLKTSKQLNFSIENLPYGIFTKDNNEKRVGVAIEDYVLDLAALEHLGLLKLEKKVFQNNYLNEFMALGKKSWEKARARIQELLDAKNSELRDHPQIKEQVLILQKDATMHMPVRVGDYTDFYSSKEHASNVGSMFRDKNNPLLPNWKHLPVAYHGRASSLVLSGTDIKRPNGQIIDPTTKNPILANCNKLDFELEMGFFIGKDSNLGDSISIENAHEYIFGMSLVNDWSARDIQKWEYVPLGPFVSKSFATSISTWITPIQALKPFLVKAPKQDPKPLEYLCSKEQQTHYDIDLAVTIETQKGSKEIISRANMKWLYWSMEQQLTHHSVTGCNLRVGDLLASGTISGTEPSSYGSLLELSWNGEKPLKINKEQRSFLENGDEIILSACGNSSKGNVNFGQVRGRIIGR